MLINYKTVFTNKKQLTGNVYLFTFKLTDPPEINFTPGQYLILKVNNKPRLYSIASSSQVKNQIEFIIEIIRSGLASQYFLRLKINDQVNFQGPAGQFTFKENNKQKIFLVTGAGIAPVRSMLSSYVSSRPSERCERVEGSLKDSSTPLRSARNDRGVAYLFWGLKTYRDVYLFDELKQFNPKICLSREQNLDMIPKEDKKYFDLGHVDQCVEKLFINGLTDCEFYLCGRKDVVESLKNFLISKNIPQENIIFEKF